MFPISRPTVKKNVPTVIFLAQEEKKKKKKKSATDPGQSQFFIYVRQIICPYQFSDIASLHCSFIYFQYGGTFTSQSEHIRADFFEACSHISA